MVGGLKLNLFLERADDHHADTVCMQDAGTTRAFSRESAIRIHDRVLLVSLGGLTFKLQDSRAQNFA